MLIGKKFDSYLLPESDANEFVDCAFERDDSVMSSPHLRWKESWVVEAAILLSTTSPEIEWFSSAVVRYLFSSSVLPEEILSVKVIFMMSL